MPGDRFCIETVNGKEIVTVLVIGKVPITGALLSLTDRNWLTA
jgi:hypothetical protein